MKRFADWARWYNTSHRHRMLGGRTPLQAWEEDPAPLRRVPTEQPSHLMLAGAERIVQKDGINFHGLAYVAPELYGRGGQRVQIRYMPHDDRTIEVYLGTEHLCTAYPTGQLTPAQTDAFREHARAEAERLGRERRRASRQARCTLAPMTSDSAPAESRLVPVADGRDRTQRDRDRALAARASTSLLGLIDPTATATADPES
ncbi:Mu transposase C-terminal domain-containing protein [Streptomyces sp. NPDC058391]|uniref:Mu transposase C-terminal domain-containing protein n=1 Tax=Streptomyces sp. NPDC058391 TaxID=3346476 RepID=UPI00366695DF